MNTEAKPGDVLDVAPSTAVQSRRAVAVKAPATPGGMVQTMLASGEKLDPQWVKEMMQLQIQWDDRVREQQFVAAMSEFRAEAIVIIKSKEVDFRSAKGRTNYRHADLARIVEAVSPALARHGLSHRWDPRQENGAIIVKTIVTHSAGHSESVELSGARDDSGNKNTLQGVGSTISYLQRYGLMAILGLASREDDDDGRRGGDGVGAAPSLEQAAAEQTMLDGAQAAALEGDLALQAWYKATQPPVEFWKAYSRSLKDAARAADRDAAARPDPRAQMAKLP